DSSHLDGARHSRGLVEGSRLAKLSSLIPAKHTQRPECVPPAGLTRRFVEWKADGLVIGAIEKPSTVGLPPALDDTNGIADAGIGRPARVPQVVERAQNVV